MRLATLVFAPLAHAFVIPFEWDVRWATNAVESVLGEKQTIWKMIKDDDKYTRIVRILEFEGSVKKELDKDALITFFAPNNEGLTPPKHRTEEVPSLSYVAQALDEEPWLLDDGGDDDDDKDKKRRRKILKRIAHAVLKYHILPDSHDAASLAQNSTMATTLHPHDGSADGLARRIHIGKELVPPGISINFYARVKSSAGASNGQVHELAHPLFPPASVFDEMFIASRWLSTSTSAIQRVGGAKYLEWGYDREKSKPGKPVFSGTPLTTFFAPSNQAWNCLPHRLHLFLFSQFGRHALRKLLMYHAVPHTLVHAELVHHAEHKKAEAELGSLNDPSFRHEFEVHSALGSPLKIVAEKKRVLPIEGAVVTSMTVNGVSVKVLDVVASNGAWHILDKVLCPPHKHKPHMADTDPWDDWEDWFLTWAEDARIQGW
ncbi:hypothetical protein CcaverHIS002_0407970 [Cutaneotrichosporon cavernicola]|nr:hypothetical protein CcaverHIS002_0407970 [Cutaneotrichosporon cavernicola]BEI99746.1 hypothetical protein CcaverHIS631_0407890 [Cutaneotrichosporon cavernicola]BEJ07522.1 hypothetical protein CcaverHIS641_0407910 [Cutaneotrichosporon cavernicola]